MISFWLGVFLSNKYEKEISGQTCLVIKNVNEIVVALQILRSPSWIKINYFQTNTYHNLRVLSFPLKVKGERENSQSTLDHHAMPIGRVSN